jgi:hypothetical protein
MLTNRTPFIRRACWRSFVTATSPTRWPKIFFREAGPMPETVTLVVATPPAHRTARGAWADQIRVMLGARCAAPS